MILFLPFYSPLPTKQISGKWGFKNPIGNPPNYALQRNFIWGRGGGGEKRSPGSESSWFAYFFVCILKTFCCVTFGGLWQAGRGWAAVTWARSTLQAEEAAGKPLLQWWWRVGGISSAREPPCRNIATLQHHMHYSYFPLPLFYAVPHMRVTGKGQEISSIFNPRLVYSEVRPIMLIWAYSQESKHRIATSESQRKR